jgi:multidrug resistance protein
MNPDADKLWQAPRWALAVLLAVLGMLGPFSIDTYIPAFSGIAQSIGATPAEMQQTLSAYLFGFAFMNLFHGALSDSFGRRPVVLWGIAVFTIASLGCALSQNITQLVLFRGLQGLSTGAGIVVSRAVIRDMFPPAEAQRVMSQVTIYFGVAPAIAPIIGGFLFVHAGWHAVFWFLVAVGVVLFVANYKLLPETLHASHRQSFHVRHLMRGYWDLCSRSALPAAGARERRALQRHVPLRAGRARLPGRPPRAAAAAVLLVLPSDHRRHHARRARQRPHGRQGDAQAADPRRLPHHAGARWSTWWPTSSSTRTWPGRCGRSRCSPSAGR